MLEKIVDALGTEFLDDLLNLVRGRSRSSRWCKVLAQHGQFTMTSIPSFSRTRSYSLSRLVQRVVKVWFPLQERIRDIVKKDPFDDAV
jgi:hypothetical protein